MEDEYEDYLEAQDSEDNHPSDSEYQDHFPPQNSNKLPSSVHEFIKQSTEIQQEIQKLSQLCQQISPKKELPMKETSSQSDSDSNMQEPDENVQVWENINGLLKSHGIAPLIFVSNKYGQPLPEINSLKDTVVELTTEFSDLYRKYQEQSDYILNLESELKSKELLEEKYKTLKLKLKEKSIPNSSKKLYEPTRNRKKENQDLKVFFAFMEKEFDRKSETHAKVLALIQNYEEKLRKLAASAANGMSREDDWEYEQISRYEAESFNLNRLKELDADLLEKNKILEGVSSQLSLKSFKDLPSAFNKIQKILTTLPALDKFVKSVCEEIVSNKFSNFEVVLQELRKLKHQKFLNDKFRARVFEQLIVGSEEEAFEKVKAFMYFCKLFEVNVRDNLHQTIDEIFFFVHEIKGFLAVRDI